MAADLVWFMIQRNQLKKESFEVMGKFEHWILDYIKHTFLPQAPWNYSVLEGNFQNSTRDVKEN